MNSVTRFGWCVLLASALAGCAARRGAGSISALEAEKLPGTNQVKSVRYDWVDSKRGRPVPVKIYFPQSGPGPFPVILFSHGMGGNRDGYEYLGRHWASHGYVSVHVQHLGSDNSVWGHTPWHGMEKMMRAATNAQNALN